MLKDKLLVNGKFDSRTKEEYIKKHYPLYYQEILDFVILYKFENFEWKRKLYHYMYDIKNIPICVCGNEINFRGRIEKIYNDFCSTKCSAINVSVKRMETLEKNNMEKYGVKNVFQLDSVKQKSKNTCLEKYGFDNQNKSVIIKNKIKETNLKKYGSEYYMGSLDFMEKSKTTCLEKYGSTHPMKNLDIKEKLKNVFIKKYGTNTISENDKFRKDNFCIAKNINYIKYIGNRISLFKCDLGKNHEFEISKNIYITRTKANNPLCTICYPISENNSIKELELLRFIQENYKGEILPGWRGQLEIDIYLPELNIGFEFNGLYWHSEEYKKNNYHLDKTLFFKDKGIKIIHIWEDDWDNKKDIIKSQIINYLGLTETKIFARKCQIREIIDSSNFLDTNHIQGNAKSVIKLGLFYNNELVSVMSFDNFEGRKKMEQSGWNLSRFCNKINYNVIGGASKLLNYFIKTYTPSRIISYADRSWSEGNLYYQLGFKLVNESKPDYKYIVNNVRENKTKYKKSKLIKNGFIGTEKEITENLGYKRIYDCGKIKFEYIL